MAAATTGTACKPGNDVARSWRIVCIPGPCGAVDEKTWANGLLQELNFIKQLFGVTHVFKSTWTDLQDDAEKFQAWLTHDDTDASDTLVVFSCHASNNKKLNLGGGFTDVTLGEVLSLLNKLIVETGEALLAAEHGETKLRNLDACNLTAFQVLVSSCFSGDAINHWTSLGLGDARCAEFSCHHFGHGVKLQADGIFGEFRAIWGHDEALLRQNFMVPLYHALSNGPASIWGSPFAALEVVLTFHLATLSAESWNEFVTSYMDLINNVRDQFSARRISFELGPLQQRARMPVTLCVLAGRNLQDTKDLITA